MRVRALAWIATTLALSISVLGVSPAQVADATEAGFRHTDFSARARAYWPEGKTCVSLGISGKAYTWYRPAGPRVGMQFKNFDMHDVHARVETYADCNWNSKRKAVGRVGITQSYYMTNPVCRWNKSYSAGAGVSYPWSAGASFTATFTRECGQVNVLKISRDLSGPRGSLYSDRYGEHAVWYGDLLDGPDRICAKAHVSATVTSGTAQFEVPLSKDICIYPSSGAGSP